MAVQSLMYGLETMRWTKNDWDRMEVTQNRIGRIALGANRYSATEALRGEAGWSTFGERVAKAVFRYKVRLQQTDENRWARQVYEWTKHRSKWNGMCEKLIYEYKMRRKMVYEKWDNWGNERWKKEINVKVQDRGREVWREGMNGKSTIEWYRTKDEPKCERFYDGSRSAELLFKARTKSLELNSRTYRWENDGDKSCKMCDSGKDETIEHVLLECVKYEQEKVCLWI